ncbi:Atrial natriuretic peptide clearance receptor [Plakobranchus ocellatus]|uniref:Atrial natriuretic peptide clearance receptor n=1 Tax=Plakobranchus ocellatus TaxID=259542 RepID=A0AAV3Z3Z2_9GAST|nr:Atrial natriuretic peptide clearance receptor [Plakobranchus ocellatus]
MLRVGLIQMFTILWIVLLGVHGFSYAQTIFSEISTTGSPSKPDTGSSETDIVSAAAQNGGSDATTRSDDVMYLCVLAPIDEYWMFSQKRILPAVSVAVDKVVAMETLPNIELKVVVGDSKCNARDGPINAFKYYYILKQVSVFLGPVCDYSLAPVARYAPVWALPVISPGGFAHDLASKRGSNPEYPTLTRLGVTFNGLSNSVLGITTGHFRWKKVKVIYEPLAKNNIMPRFCYLAAAALINVTKEIGGLEHDFFIYVPDRKKRRDKDRMRHREKEGRHDERETKHGNDEFADLLLTEVGNIYGSKFVANCGLSLL